VVTVFSWWYGSGYDTPRPDHYNRHLSAIWIGRWRSSKFRKNLYRLVSELPYKANPFHRNYPATLSLGTPFPLHTCRCGAEIREHPYIHSLLWWGDCWNNHHSNYIFKNLNKFIFSSDPSTLYSKSTFPTQREVHQIMLYFVLLFYQNQLSVIVQQDNPNLEKNYL